MRLLRACAIGLSCYQALYASGTGVLPIGDPIAAAKTPAGSIQAGTLERRGDVLAAVPQSNCLSQIVVHAPGAERISFVLRERELRAGMCMVQITAAEGELNLVKRVTLFLKTGSPSNQVFLSQSGAWQHQPSQELPVPGTEKGVAKAVTAATTKNFGLFLLKAGSSKTVTLELPPPEFGSFDRGTRLARGAWHLLWPSVTLLLLLGISRVLHARTPRTL